MKIVFNEIAIVKSIKAEGTTLANAAEKMHKAREATNLEFAKLVDNLTLAWADTKVSKAQFWGKPSGELRKAVKAIVANGESLGAWQKDMSEALVHCIGVSFMANVPFTRNLKVTHTADGALRKPKREAADGAEKAGAVTTTDPAAAEKTARKLIAQLRTLGNDVVAAGIVDVMLEFNPAFTETEPAKA